MKYDKLNVGCGDEKLESYLNVDREVDLNKVLPYNDNSFKVIRCYHVLEHLIDVEFTMKQFKRVLKKGGVLKVKLPLNTCCYEHKRYRHTFGYFYNLKKDGWCVRKIKYTNSKFGVWYRDTIRRFIDWFMNIFHNEIYFEIINENEGCVIDEFEEN